MDETKDARHWRSVASNVLRQKDMKNESFFDEKFGEQVMDMAFASEDARTRTALEAMEESYKDLRDYRRCE